MKPSMLYRVFVVCTWSGYTEVRLVPSLLHAGEIEELFKEFDWIRVVTEPAPLAYLKLSATPAAA